MMIRELTVLDQFGEPEKVSTQTWDPINKEWKDIKKVSVPYDQVDEANKMAPDEIEQKAAKKK